MELRLGKRIGMNALGRDIRRLWQQSMDLQMGRIPQTAVVQWSAPLRIVPIEDDEANSMLFEVWQEEM